MTPCDQNNYEPLLKDKDTRNQIMSANRIESRVDPRRPIQVRVYNELDKSETPLVATGALSKDFVWLDVTFTMPDGKVGFRTYDFKELTTKIDTDFT